MTGAIVALWWASLPDSPDAFYRAPDAAARRPGDLLRQEAFARGIPAGSRGWRILYATTRGDGAPAVASAIVVAPAAAREAARPMVAWTHGTTGVEPGCAPSVLAAPFANVPALDDALAQGWVVVATDYVGLGTTGPHPYLVGEGEGRSALDAVRAAKHLEGLRLDGRTVVWGHSQGGHAALWTGILAPRYAPDVEVVGVAALAPASDLPRLLVAVQDTAVGRIMSSFLVRAYVETYAELSFDDQVRAVARVVARDMARRCLAGRRAIASVLESMALGRPIFAGDPASGALGRRLLENVPDGAIGVPLLIAQGAADDLVRPAVQAAFVERRCAAGQALAYWTYAGRDHLSLVAPDSPLAGDLMRWTAERFAGRPAAPGCVTVAR